MHHIQVKILKRLLYAGSLNYAALRPNGVESNHFAYHLEQLVKDKLIIKEDSSYRLSPAGTTFVDRLSQDKMVPRQQPIIVTAIDLTAPSGRTLFFRRNFQPYLGLAGFPMGKLHLGETAAQAAERELQEKTGLTDIALTHRGMVYVEGRAGGEFVSKMLYHVFHGETGQELQTTTLPERGACFWADHAMLDPAELIPGFLEIKSLIASQTSLFFAEITANVSTPDSSGV